MAKMRLIYKIDVGMAVMAGVFIAIVIFLPGEGYFIPVLLGYGAAVMVWAFLAESAAIKVLTPNDFADLAEVETRLLAFQHRYQQTARPFEWKFTRTDLAALLNRLAQHDALPRAA